MESKSQSVPFSFTKAPSGEDDQTEASQQAKCRFYH